MLYHEKNQYMIKIFRKIRMQLLAENMLNRYLIYAIGEIMLVVVGILIALSINNWNNKKIERQTELKIYENIKNQIHEDEELLNGDVEYNLTYSKQYYYVKCQLW